MNAAAPTFRGSRDRPPHAVAYNSDVRRPYHDIMAFCLAAETALTIERLQQQQQQQQP